ncbi:serine/threonine-protein kinase [Catenulispora rubra]|uniref:serine/threonine-protein kinase n=1 Tax=Catenulispora rubra TaxID=280293 RepID=UPI0018923919|nr:serine/threonine-protein kinase [Catenulispora rubra]
MRTRSGQPQAFHPARIGPYEVVRRLGAGAMGEVYLARSASSRLVAVKTIRSGLAEHPGYRRRFAHEVDAAKRVSGAFTAAVVGADPHADLPWLATVYVPAPSLEELVATCGPLAVSAVRWLAAGCAEALECVHRAGLVHRDFKPANVLVTADGPRVIDFGLARRDGLPQGTAAGMVLGTPLYMAPEQAAGEPVVGPAADVFALGATLYHAATGAALYQEEKAVGVLLQKMRRPPDLAQVPREVRGLVAACLALKPTDRPTPASLLAALAPHLAGADSARPLPDAVLEYIEGYRSEQMELARTRRSTPDAASEGSEDETHVAVRSADSFGDLSEPVDETVFTGDGAFDVEAGTADDSPDGDPRPRHPSLPPDQDGSHWVPASRAASSRRRARAGSGVGRWGPGRWQRRSPMGPAVVAGSVVLAIGAATISALFLAGVVTLGSKDSNSTQAGAGPAAATGATSGVTGGATSGVTCGRPAGSPPGSPPPTASSPPPTRSGPPLQGPPPGGGPPQGPPPGAATVVDGTRLDVRPPFGDPRTTFILEGVGWPAGQTVTVTFLDAAVPQATTVVDGSGTISVALDQGAGSIVLPDGRYHVRASSGNRSLSVSFVVGPPLNP